MSRSECVEDAYAGSAEHYLMCSLAGQMYALPVLAVDDILQHVGVIRVPLVPQFVRGVLDFGEGSVPVIDLSARLGGTPCPAGEGCIVVVLVPADDRPQPIGLVVEAVADMRQIASLTLESSLKPGGVPARSAPAAEFISGLATADGRTVIVLDTDRLLDVENIAIFSDMFEDTDPYFGILH
ncbi:MAG: chemotaxis protein CheW [Rhodocyclaceae bacterium]|nr:chemotaxis protein CheW [Rhodocyclaceae bacterium]